MIINYLDEKGENVVSPKLHLGEEEEENHQKNLLDLLYLLESIK